MWCADRQGWAARTEHPSQPVWVTGSPQDIDNPCPVSSAAGHPAFSKPFALPVPPDSAQLPGRVTDRRPLVTDGSRGQPAKHGQQLATLARAAGLFPTPQSCCHCGGRRCWCAGPGGSHQPPVCMRCWPEGSGCTRHICIQAEPGFTSPPRLTVLGLAGSPSPRPGKDR